MLPLDGTMVAVGSFSLAKTFQDFRIWVGGIKKPSSLNNVEYSQHRQFINNH